MRSKEEEEAAVARADEGTADCRLFVDRCDDDDDDD